MLPRGLYCIRTDHEGPRPAIKMQEKEASFHGSLIGDRRAVNDVTHSHGKYFADKVDALEAPKAALE